METFLQLILAVLLGGLVGLEREYNRKNAGLRTFALVSLGAAFFTIIAFESFKVFSGGSGIGFDPSRIVGQIVLGIGFVSAGLIIHREFRVEGLTTSAGLWVAAAIGAAVGLKLYWPAVFVAILVIVLLAGLRQIEERFIWAKGSKKKDEKKNKK